MYLGLIQLFIFWLLGESISFVFDLSINGAVLGMLLFFIFLMWNNGTNENTLKAGDFLIKALPLLLLPGSVAIFFLGELMEGKWLKVFLAVILSSFATMIFTLLTMQKIINMSAKKPKQIKKSVNSVDAKSKERKN